MATENWSASTSRGNLLTTQLNALANGSYSAVGTELDNATNKDRFAVAVLTCTWGSAPTLNATVELYAVCAVDGTNYEDGSASLRYPYDAFCGVFQCYNNTSAQILVTRPFELRPFKTKFAVYNGSGQNMPASGTTVGIYTFNRTIG